MANKIGLLVPRSAIYPSINFDMVNGVRNGAKYLGYQDWEFRIDTVGYGTDDKLIYEKCEQLLFEGISIVIAYINPTTAEKLQPLFANAQGLLIALDAGYHFPLKPDRLDNVITISLHGGVCCRAIAGAAAAAGHKNVGFTASFYDAGYRSCYTIAKGFEEVNIPIVVNHITKLKRAEFTLAPVNEVLESKQADALVAAFCGDMAVDFYNNVAVTDAPVYGTPFLADEQWLAQTTYPGFDTQVFTTWISGLDNPANKAFIDTMTEANANVNLFSLLGWEAAIVAGLAVSGGEPAKLPQRLEGYEGPRGSMKFNQSNNNVESPVYKVMVTGSDGSPFCTTELVAAYDASEEYKMIQKDVVDFGGKGTSWFNAYGCIES